MTVEGLTDLLQLEIEGFQAGHSRHELLLVSLDALDDDGAVRALVGLLRLGGLSLGGLLLGVLLGALLGFDGQRGGRGR